LRLFGSKSVQSTMWCLLDAALRVVRGRIARSVKQLAVVVWAVAAGYAGQKAHRAWLAMLWILLPGLFVLAPVPLSAERPWYPYPVKVPAASGDVMSREKTIDYVPLERAQRKWSVAVFFPHMKDSYWLAVDFGVVREARRLGIRMRLFQAGGYDNLPVQIAQIRKAVAEGADGVIIGAISYDALDGLVDELQAGGVPVIDVVNRIRSGKVSARSLVSFEDMGYQAGNYIARRHPKGSRPVRVAWFPGPKGAGWVKDGDAGFRRAVDGSSVEVVAVRYGDTGKATQTALIEDVLNRHPDIDYLVGTAVSATAAAKVLRARGLSDRVKVMAYYLTPEVYRGIKRGHILGAPTDSPVIQGCIAVDQVVRLLEHKPCLRSVGPQVFIVDSRNVDTFDRRASMAPSGFRATYSVNLEEIRE
jgi:protein TorT